MAFDKIGLENLPNAYFSQIKIDKCVEGAVVKIIPSEIITSIFDYSNPSESIWRNQKLLKDFLKIKVCFVCARDADSKRAVQDVVNGNLFLKDLKNVTGIKMVSSDSAAKDYYSSVVRDPGLDPRVQSFPLGTVTQFRKTTNFDPMQLDLIFWEDYGYDVYAFIQAFIDVEELKSQFDADFGYTEHQHYLGPLKAEKIYSDSQEVQRSRIFYTKSGAATTEAIAETDAEGWGTSTIQGDLDRVNYGAVHLKAPETIWMEGSFHSGRNHEMLNVLNLQTQTKIRHGDDCGGSTFSAVPPGGETAPGQIAGPTGFGLFGAPPSGDGGSADPDMDITTLPSTMTQFFELDPPGQASIPGSSSEDVNTAGTAQTSVPFSGILPTQGSPAMGSSVGTSEGISTGGHLSAGENSDTGEVTADEDSMINSSELIKWGLPNAWGGSPGAYDKPPSAYRSRSGQNGRGVSAIMEPETSTNEDGSINVVTAINYQELLLQNDYISQILRNKNPVLFESLENLIQIDSISMTRSEVHSRRHLNRLGTRTGDLPAPDHTKQTIISTAPVKGKFETKTKFVLNNGVSHVVNPTQIKAAPQGFIGQGLHTDDLSEAANVAQIKELDLTKSRNLSFLALTDNSISREGGNKFKYGIEIEFTSKTIDFINNVVKSIEDFSTRLSTFQKSAELPGSYDYEKLTWKDDFFILMNQSGGFDVQRNGKKFKFNSGGNSSSTQQAIWIQGPLYYSAGLSLLGISNKNVVKKLFSHLNPVSSSPSSLLSSHRLFVNLISEIRKAYDLGVDQTKKHNLNSSSKRSMKTRDGVVKSKHVVSKVFNSTISAEPNPESGFKFLGAKKQSMPSLTKASYRKRVKQERTKFFKKAVGTRGKGFDGLSLKEKKALVNLDSSYRFFTPIEIKMGNEQKSLIETNKSIFDNDFFNKLSLVQASRFGEESSNKFSTLSEEANLAKVATNFGFTIAPSMTSIASLPIEKQEDFHDVRNFLGDNSHLSKAEEKLFKLHIPTFSKEEKLDSKKLMANFANLKASAPTEREISLENFDLQSNKSSFKSFIGNKNSEKKLKNLPVSIKALLIDSEDNQSSIRFPMTLGAFDPLKNIQTRQSVEQNFLNIRKLEYLAGFKIANGKIDLAQPIWVAADSAFASQKSNHLCRLVPYEKPHLGIKSPSNPPPTFDSLFVMKGRK